MAGSLLVGSLAAPALGLPLLQVFPKGFGQTRLFGLGVPGLARSVGTFPVGRAAAHIRSGCLVHRLGLSFRAKPAPSGRDLEA